MSFSESARGFALSNRDQRYARLFAEETKKQQEVGKSFLKTLERSMSSPSSSMKNAMPIPTLSEQELKDMGVGWEAPSCRERPGLNSQYTPHPTHLRGIKRLSKMGLLDRGIDPLKDKGYRCTLWEAPLDRFERNAAIPGSKVSVPHNTDGFRSREALVEPGVYEKPWKINHVWPVKTGNGGIGSDIRLRPPGEWTEQRRLTGQGPFWPLPPQSPANSQQ
eukprot:TRINITY_DN19311_c1_g1_i1.p1 TRINITY_DN19311_c1_g1~~TRINITY_DN19311_c1_g1_i1.p1  ORF type:complete len:220 (+),score=40.85 TRINITY_DN19311_c1_g1_i1:84-743(+)